MKTTTTITLDVELIAEARMRKLKLSTLFNKYLSTYLQMEQTTQAETHEDKIISLKAALMSAEAELKKQKEKQEEKLKPRVEFRDEW